jgi:hypothetical protein
LDAIHAEIGADPRIRRVIKGAEAVGASVFAVAELDRGRACTNRCLEALLRLP